MTGHVIPGTRESGAAAAGSGERASADRQRVAGRHPGCGLRPWQHALYLRGRAVAASRGRHGESNAAARRTSAWGRIPGRNCPHQRTLCAGMDRANARRAGRLPTCTVRGVPLVGLRALRRRAPDGQFRLGVAPLRRAGVMDRVAARQKRSSSITAAAKPSTFWRGRPDSSGCRWAGPGSSRSPRGSSAGCSQVMTWPRKWCRTSSI